MLTHRAMEKHRQEGLKALQTAWYRLNCLFLHSEGGTSNPTIRMRILKHLDYYGEDKVIETSNPTIRMRGLDESGLITPLNTFCTKKA